MHARARVGTAAGAVVAAMLTATAPAHAQVLRDDDRGGDVFVYQDSGSTESSDRRVNVAVDRVTVRHTDRAVVARVEMKNLRRDGGYFVVTMSVSNEETSTFDLGVYYDTDGSRNLTHYYSSREDDSATCPGLKHAVDFAEDVVTLRAPRSCLGRPERVRFSGFALSSLGTRESRVIDPFLSSTGQQTFSGWIARG